jgi:hypothetical protein
MSEQIRFRSRYFTKDQIREQEDWMNEHFQQGYAVVLFEETDSGRFVQLVRDPGYRIQSRVRFFYREMETDLDRWLEQKIPDGWSHDIRADREGYWVLIQRENGEITLPASRMLLAQMVELWWLWFLMAAIFGILYFTTA